MTSQYVRLPTADRVLDLHRELAEAFAGTEDAIAPAGARDMNLLESACLRPTTSLMGTDKYPTLPSKAAALFHSLVKNHPFHNGNKRTALLTLIRLLAEHDRRMVATDQELFDFVVAVADGTVPNESPPKDTDDHVEQIRHWITDHSDPIAVEPSAMRISAFLEQCKKVGCEVRDKDGGWLILGPYGTSIRIAGSTRKIDGPAIKRYVGMLGFSQGVTGLPFSEFQSGLDDTRRTIVEYMSVFRWLAKT